MSEPQKKSQSGPLLKPFTYRVLVAVALGTAAIVFLYLLFNAIRVLLLLFSGILLAVLLNGVSNWVHEHSPFSRRAALALVIASIFLMLGFFGWMITPGLVRQADQLGNSLTESLLDIEQELRRQDWGRRLLEQVQGFPGNLAQGSDILSGITGFFSRTLGAVVDFAIFLFIGIFLAVNPDDYLHV